MNKRVLVASLVFAMSFGAVSAAVPREETKAAIAFLYDKSKPTTMLTTKKAKNIYVGEKALDIDYSIGGKKSGVKGTWKSSNPKKIKVSKSGKVKAVGAGAAIISFQYQSNGKKYTIKCKVVSKVRDKVKGIRVVKPSDFDGTMATAALAEFKVNFVTDTKEIDAVDLSASYVVEYEVFANEACTTPAPLSLAVIDKNGRLRTKDEKGIVYIRAVAKTAKKSKKAPFYSEPVAVNIGAKVSLNRAVVKQTALDKFDIELEGAEKVSSLIIRDLQGGEIKHTKTLSSDGNILHVQAEKALKEKMYVVLSSGDKTEQILYQFEDQKVADFKLTSDSAALVSFFKGKGTAEVGYRLLDQFGNDITSDYRFKKTYAFWNSNTPVDLSGSKITIPLSADQLVGYTGELEFTYAGDNQEPYVKTIKLRIGNFSVLKEVKIMGVYKKNKDSSYTKVMDGETYLPIGTIINHYIANEGSYYLLMRAKDSNGNSFAEEGIGAEKLLITISTNTGLGLEIPIGKNAVQSVAPVTINGENLLAYPLKTGVLQAGDVVIQVQGTGTNLSDIMKSKVAATSGVEEFRIIGEGVVDKENRIQFVILNSKKEMVTKFEEVLSTLGLTTYNGFVPYDSNVIFSAKGSGFLFKKNEITGEAELYYKPNRYSIPSGFSQNKEEIILQRGSEKEKKVYLTVKSK